MNVFTQHIGRYLISSFVALNACLLSCSPTDAQQIVPGVRPVIRPQEKSAAIGNPHATVSDRRPDTTDVWFLVELDGQRVGYEHLATTFNSRPSPRGDDPAALRSQQSGDSVQITAPIRRVRETRLAIRRFGTEMSLTAVLETQETDDGILRNWSLRRTDAEGAITERQGVWKSDLAAWEITERVQATRRSFSLPSGEPVRSAIISAWAPALAARSAQRFRSAVLFPETSSVQNVDFESSGNESLRQPDGQTIKVARISFWPNVDPLMKTTLFVDETGQVVRSEQPLLGRTLSMQKSDPATALGGASLESLDLELASVIPVIRPITNPSRREQTQLRITTGVGDLLTLPNSKFQQVETVSGNQAVVTLLKPQPIIAADKTTGTAKPGITSTSQVLPGFNSTSSGSAPSTDEFLMNTRWTNTDNPYVQRVARSAAGGSLMAAETCRRMSRYLFTNLKRSQFSTAFVSAGETARQMRGDCTEHAVLLASIMRVYRIPSRVVAGFVYSDRAAGFTPHMWTEALLEGEWIPFDSTVGPDGLSATYLRVTDSSLSDEVSSGTLIFLPLLNLMGRAKIEVLTESGF